uniref:Putative trim56 protein n=1 Tax=Schistosoma mansoni TaxID=6183 RepID=A0A3Q0KG24_SCHMA
MLDESCESSDGLDNIFSDDFSKISTLEEAGGLPTLCGICEKPFTNPVILSCLHIFDRECVRNFEKNDSMVPYTKCPRCDTLSGSVRTLEAYDLSVAQTRSEGDGSHKVNGAAVKCSVCTDGNDALYRCLHCAGTLCERCRDIHKVMKVFSNHEILDLTEEEKGNAEILQRNMLNTKPVICTIHPESTFTSFCLQCHIPLCETCFECEHKGHITILLGLVPTHIDSLLSDMVECCRLRQKDFRDSIEMMHSLLSELSSSRDANKSLINKTCKQWITSIERIKDQFIHKNREIHDELEMKIWSRINTMSKTVDHVDFACDFVKVYLKKCSNIEICKLFKNVLACFDKLSKQQVVNDPSAKAVFSPGLSAYDVIHQHFGTFSFTNGLEQDLQQVSNSLLEGFPAPNPHIAVLSSVGDITNDLKQLTLKVDGHMDPDPLSGLDHSVTVHLPPVSLVQQDGTCENINPSAVGNGNINNYISRSSNSGASGRHNSNWCDLNVTLPNLEPSDFLCNVTQVDPIFSNPFITTDNLRAPGSNVSTLDVDSSLILKQKLPVSYNATLYEYSRMRAARCSQMNLLTKWGSLGCELGRLNSPHGFCLGFEEEIVVADTYNHRIQIFTKRGDFVSFFGVSGRVDGLMWYPRKVAIIRQSQRYVVCDRGNERSRMQLFSRSGHFVRRIPIRYIDIVAGLAINQHGHIVAIDSVSPSVFVVSEEGDLIRWFDCSNHMREPSDVAIHGREYYICDFKAHCVIVFQEDGSFIRRIGGESITDFPNGIDVSDHGDVLVGDSHGNRFHIAVFSRSGELLSEFVCNQTKVSRSCCLKITTEGYVVTLARSSNNVLVLNTLYIC